MSAPTINLAALDPGIRRTVEWLRSQGFNTTDSGDGRSKPAVGRDFEVPHVFMVTAPDVLLSEARRLRLALASRGIKARADRRSRFHIQATFDPSDESAVIGLFGVDDARLAAARARAT